MRTSRTRATTAEWSSLYPWHFGGSVPTTGPVIGVDQLAGGSPFGIDPFGLVAAGVAQNPNVVVCGAPANGKSAFVKSMLWFLTGAFGYRFVATDVKSEYTALARALDVPVLDLHPGGDRRVNPLDDPDGRLEFVRALGSLCVDRPLSPVEGAVLSAAVRRLPDDPVLEDLVGLIVELPSSMCDELRLEQRSALEQTAALRFGLGDLLSGSLAGMFNGRSNVDLSDSKRGFVVDVSKCGSDDRILRFALLAGQRASNQMVRSSAGRTISANDEAWRLAGTSDLVRWLQHDFKLGRQQGKANIIVVHRLAEIGAQTDGATAAIASRLVSDADIHILFRQGDRDDAADAVERLGLPRSTQDALARLPAHRCLVHVRGHLAMVDVMLSARMFELADTNAAMRHIPTDF